MTQEPQGKKKNYDRNKLTLTKPKRLFQTSEAKTASLVVMLHMGMLSLAMVSLLGLRKILENLW